MSEGKPGARRLGAGPSTSAPPEGYPAMAETGNIPIHHKILEKGVKDMVRIDGAITRHGPGHAAGDA